MAINEDTCLHGGSCADIYQIYVYIVGTGHMQTGIAGIYYVCMCALTTMQTGFAGSCLFASFPLIEALTRG